MKTQPMTAWLIMWEWEGNHAAVETPYVDIVSFRKNIPYVKEYLQRLHDLNCLSLRERMSAARYNRPPKPIYEATVHRTTRGVEEIHCGHNPYLVARPVRNLTIETDSSTGAEVVRWTPYKKSKVFEGTNRGRTGGATGKPR